MLDARCAPTPHDMDTRPAKKILSSLSLGQKILGLREAKGLTQAALAALLGVSDSTVGRWEDDQIAPRFSRLKAIAAALEVRQSVLTDDVPEDVQGKSCEQVAARESLRLFLGKKETKQFKLLAEGSVGELDHSILTRQFTSDREGRADMSGFRSKTKDLPSKRTRNLRGLVLLSPHKSHRERLGMSGQGSFYFHDARR